MGIAAAIAGAAVIGGVATAVTGPKAANAQKDAANQSIAEQRRQYDQSRADLAPWRTAGAGALGKLAGLYGVSTDGTANSKGTGFTSDFTASPGYDWRLSQGLKAIDRKMSSRGLLNGRPAVEAEQRFGEGLASSEFENYANHLAGIAGVGQAATNTTVQAGENAANNISNGLIQAGNARASSYANIGSAINGTVNNMASAYLYGQGGGFGGGGKTPTNPYSNYNMGFG